MTALRGRRHDRPGGRPAGSAGETGGRWLGAAARTALCGPICGIAGSVLGGRVGAMAGRALGGTIANMMEDTNEAAETETKPTEATQPCEKLRRRGGLLQPARGSIEVGRVPASARGAAGHASTT